MRRITALLMAVVTLFAFTSCECKVENEDKALKVYTCPSDNMYGLEKIVVFEDGITMVFDKRMCDKSEYAEFDEFETGDELFGKYMGLRGKLQKARLCIGTASESNRDRQRAQLLQNLP